MNTVAELKKKIPELKQELQSDEGFKNVYKFTFNFSKENAGSKCLEFESAKGIFALFFSFFTDLWYELFKFSGASCYHSSSHFTKNGLNS